MKKVILSLALVAGATFAAQAQASDNTTATLNMTITDYITITPPAVGPVNYNFATPAAMAAGQAQGPTTYTVVASRAWNGKYTASDFARDNGVGYDNVVAASHGIELSVPVGDVLQLQGSAGSGTAIDAGYTSYAPAATGPQPMVSAATGGTAQSFGVAAKITPGFSHNLSGKYSSNLELIVALN